MSEYFQAGRLRGGGDEGAQVEGGQEGGGGGPSCRPPDAGPQENERRTGSQNGQI